MEILFTDKETETFIKYLLLSIECFKLYVSTRDEEKLEKALDYESKATEMLLSK